MTTPNISPWLQPFKFVRNGKYPDADMRNLMAGLGNHVSMFRMKEIASFGQTTSVIASPASVDERPRWRTRYEPSPYAVCVLVKAWLAQSALEDAGADPYALVTLDNGTDTGTCELHYGAAAVEDANPDHDAVLFGAVFESPGVYLAPNPATQYKVTVSDFQSRIIACSIFEGSINQVAPFSEGFAVSTPILDEHIRQLITGARNMWKQQGAPLFTWSVDDQSAPRTRTSATEINIIDNSSTGIAADKPGFTVDLRNRARVSTGTVGVRFRVWAKTASGSAGVVKLYDSDGVVAATVDTISTTEQWYETTAELPATRAKYDIHYAGDGTNQVSVYAVNCVQYTA